MRKGLSNLQDGIRGTNVNGQGVRTGACFYRPYQHDALPAASPAIQWLTGYPSHEDNESKARITFAFSGAPPSVYAARRCLAAVGAYL